MAARLSYLLLTAAIALAQRYPIRIVDASPAMRDISVMTTDARGAIWVATADQVLLFDGTRSLAVPDPQRLLRGTTSISATSTGWVATSSPEGLAVFHPALSPVPRRLLTQPILGLNAHGAWIYVNAGVRDRVRGEELIAINPSTGARLSAKLQINQQLTVGPEGRLWFGCGTDACDIELADPPRWPPVPHRAPLLGEGGSATSVIQDRAGCLWARDNGATFRRCPGQSAATFLAGIAQSELAQIGIDREGNVWLPGTPITVFTPDQTRITLTSRNGVPNGPRFWLQGKDGTTWLTTADGLAMWPNFRRWEYWGKQDGFGDAEPMSTLQLANGAQIAATFAGIFKLNEQRSAFTPLLPAEPPLRAFALAASGPNTFLAGFFSEQIREYDDAGKERTRTYKGLADSVMSLVPRTEPDSWWAAGSSAARILERHAGGYRLRLAAALPPVGNGLDAELVQPGNLLYACSDRGLLIGKEGDWRFIDKSHGLEEDSGRSIAVRHANEVFYGYATREGFCRIRLRDGQPPQVDQYNEAKGYGISRIHAMDIDRKRGWLWRGSRDGLKAAPLDAVDQPDQWVPFGQWEGFGDALTVGQQGITIDPKDGSLWVGAGNEMHHFWPDEELFRTPADPRVFLASIQRNGRAPEFAPAALPTVEEGSSLTLRLGSLFFQRRGSLEYRYKLDGVEQALKGPAIALEKLAAGRHRLEVQARVRPSREWRTADSWEFDAVYPARRNPYYYGGGATFAGLALGATLLHKKRKVAQFQRQKQELLDSLKGRRQSSDPAVLRMLSAARNSFQPVFAAAPAADLLAPGTVLAERYELGRLCGSGGFSHVYAAEDLERRETVAIKVYTETPNRDKAWLAARMEQEVEALERLRHPHIVRFLAHGVTPGGAPYLVMNFVAGESLRAVLEKGDAFPIARVLRLLDLISSALEALHAAGIVHRDLKPENILIDGDRATLIDFSIAIVKDPRATQHSLTRAAGSWPYMAPEQLVGYGAPATDIYALALIVFELLTGKQASQLGLGAATGHMGRDLEAKLGELRPELAPLGPSPLGGAVALEVLARPQQAGAFAGAIREWLAPLGADPVA